jgi:hypothetical protein
MDTLYAALIVFSLTTALGLYLSSLVFRRKKKPFAVIVIHVLCYGIGFILHSLCSPAPLESLVLFITASLCGIILIYQDLTVKKSSRWLCLAHRFTTLAGLILLFIVTRNSVPL